VPHLWLVHGPFLLLLHPRRRQSGACAVRPRRRRLRFGGGIPGPVPSVAGAHGGGAGGRKRQYGLRLRVPQRRPGRRLHAAAVRLHPAGRIPAEDERAGGVPIRRGKGAGGAEGGEPAISRGAGGVRRRRRPRGRAARHGPYSDFRGRGRQARVYCAWGAGWRISKGAGL
jgi:hypothetical protein